MDLPEINHLRFIQRAKSLRPPDWFGSMSLHDWYEKACQYYLEHKDEIERLQLMGLEIDSNRKLGLSYSTTDHTKTNPNQWGMVGISLRRHQWLLKPINIMIVQIVERSRTV